MSGVAREVRWVLAKLKWASSYSTKFEGVKASLVSLADEAAQVVLRLETGHSRVMKLIQWARSLKRPLEPKSRIILRQTFVNLAFLDSGASESEADSESVSMTDCRGQ